MMNQRLEHEHTLETLWGNDIAKFPAHLATINLAINNLSSDRNYPNILHEDFFKLIVGESGFDPESWRKSRAKTLGLMDRDIVYPRWFDAIVGNPPYTRQEEIPETGVDKENLIENALKVGGIKIAEIS
jgi:tRNA1(Val) A37 N6-methylase TrmN6